MPLIPYLGKSPSLAEEVFIADSAIVIGDARIGRQSSIWFNVVMRADVSTITIGQRTNVQDGAIIHADPEYATVIGDDCTIGHSAVVHGAVLGSGCLVGIGAIILNGAVLGEGCIIGAGAVVAERQVFPPHSLVLGVPGRVVKKVSPEQAAMPPRAAEAYVRHGQEYQSSSLASRPAIPNRPVIGFRRQDATLPALHRAHADDAGADLIAVEDCKLGPGETGKVATNTAIALPAGYYAVVSGRSGLNSQGILTHMGTIDPGYRGIISVALTNLSKAPFEVRRGHRIAQLVVLPLVLPIFEDMADLPSSERGDRGWGSSGR